MQSDSARTGESACAAAAAATAPDAWIEGLSAEMPLSEALDRILRQRLGAVLSYLDAAEGRAVEPVHKLRVSTRRLAAALDVLGQGLPEAVCRRVLRLARKVRRAGTALRQLDVERASFERLLPHASLEDAAVIELLCERADRRRKKAHKALRGRLGRFERSMRKAGEELLETLRPGEPPDAEPSLGEFGLARLEEELAAIWPGDGARLEEPEELHRLRVACKHLRYASEPLIAVLSETFRDDFYPQLKQAQDLLGDYHDAVEGTRELRRVRRKWKKRRGSKKWDRSGLASFTWREVRAGLETVELAYAQQADHARTEFLDFWPGFAGDSFRGPVTELLAGLRRRYENGHASSAGLQVRPASRRGRRAAVAERLG